MTLEQFTDLTVVHNRKWATEAGESFDVVTQREIIDAHANGIATFMLQGLVDATRRRAEEDSFSERATSTLARLQLRVGSSAHYGLPQITLVLPLEPEIRNVKSDAGEVASQRLFLPAGRLFVVAEGQHRREAARRVRDFLNEVIANRRAPKWAKFYPIQDTPLTSEEIESWIAVQDTFRSWTVIAYEAHIGLSVGQARQLFTNFNCHVKPVRVDLNLTFDQANPINSFAKDWLVEQIAATGDGRTQFDLRQLASINALLFIGKTTIKGAPYNVDDSIATAKEFWLTVLGAPSWTRSNSRVREVAVLKGLAKSWFYVFLAKRNGRPEKEARLLEYIRTNRFDDVWARSVPGLDAHLVPTEDKSFRFSPAHNDIIAKIVAHALE
jgi:hypothetical protein